MGASKAIDGARVENVCNKVFITLNKNSVPSDTSALVPGGVRLGAHALTSRGFTEENFIKVVDMIDEAVDIAKTVQGKSKKLKDFKEVLETDEAEQPVQGAKRQSKRVCVNLPH